MIRKGMETGITIPKHCSHLKSLFKTFSHILCTDIGQQGSTLFFYKLPTIAALYSQDFQKWAVRGPTNNSDLHCCMLVSYSSSSSASSNLGSWCSSWMQTHSKLIRKCWLYSAIKVEYIKTVQRSLAGYFIEKRPIIWDLKLVYFHKHTVVNRWNESLIMVLTGC